MNSIVNRFREQDYENQGKAGIKYEAAFDADTRTVEYNTVLWYRIFSHCNLDWYDLLETQSGMKQSIRL